MTTLLGIATALPTYGMDQSQAIREALSRASRQEEKDFLETIFASSGVSTRNSVLIEKKDTLHVPFFWPSQSETDLGPTTEQRMKQYELKAPPLALEASKKALKNAGVKAESVRHLITVSCTGFVSPGFDIALVKGLSLSNDVSRTHVGFMGCHAAINALRVANHFSRACPDETILICSVELSSLHYAYHGSPGQLVANSLFSDGAGAAVLSGARRPSAWSLLATRGSVIPKSEFAMSWKIGDHGFEMELSSKVPQLIEMNLKSWLDSWLSQMGWRQDAIRS